MDIKAYHRRVAQREADLRQQFPDGFLFVTSVNNAEKQLRAGTVHEVSVRNAARHLEEHTHEISTEAEIQAYEAHNAVVRETLISQRDAAKGQKLNIRIKE